MSNPTIYRVNNCVLQVGGKSYPVSAFRVNLAENGIPSITVGFDIQLDANKVQRLTPKDYFDIYNSAQEYCDRRNKASFTFEAKAFTGADKGDTQKLELKDWLCASSGCTRFTATGGLVFGITLKHPAFALYRSAASLVGLDKSKIDSLKYQDGGSNLLAGITLGMKLFAEQRMLSVDNKELQALHHQYVDITEKIADIFIAPGLRYPNLTSEVLVAAKDTVIDYIDSIVRNANPFKMIVDTILPHWLLSAKPQYDNQIKISALEPWDEPTVPIQIDHITDITFPASELDPISGVYLAGSWLVGKAHSALNPQAGNTTFQSETSAGYARLNDDGEALGSIIQLHMPPWFEHGILYARGDSALNEKYSGAGASAYDQEESNIQIQEQHFINYATDIHKLVDDLFTLQYKSTASMGFVMRLSMQYAAKDLMPGVVFEIKDDKGKPAIRGYIVGVTHYVDVKGQTSETTVEARYVRRPLATVQGKQVYKSQLYGGAPA